MKVEQILQSKGVDVFAVNDQQTIAEAVGILGDKNVGAVVVKSASGDVVGILSERDVVRQLSNGGGDVLNKPVAAAMTSNPFTCKLDDTVDGLMAQMSEKRIRHLPVVDQGRLVGIVSIGDIVKRKIEQTEQEAAALKEYISS